MKRLRQPKDLEEAVRFLKDYRKSKKDIDFIKNNNSGSLHFSFGMFLRNHWHLWEKNTPIVKWFKETYKLEHGDNLSGIILDAWFCDVKGVPRQTDKLVKRFNAHWKKYGK